MDITIVNKNDNVIGSKVRGTLDLKDIYRVSALWITNSKGEILLARRHKTKKRHPEVWGPAVSGTVEEKESYEKNILKEAEEEIGIKDLKFKLGPKIRPSKKNHRFCQFYTLEIDREIEEFIIQEDEVEEIKWFSKEEIEKSLKENPKEFLPTMKKYIKLFT